jgi:hypothetical protein
VAFHYRRWLQARRLQLFLTNGGEKNFIPFLISLRPFLVPRLESRCCHNFFGEMVGQKLKGVATGFSHQLL